MRGTDVALPVFILGGWSAPPVALPLGECPNAHCTGDWVGLVGRSGWVRKLSPPPEFESRTADQCRDVKIPISQLCKLKCNV